MSYLGLETVKPIKPMKRGDLYSFPITTIDQIVTDEKTNERLPEYLDKNFGMDLLWQNASPTSPMYAQTLNIDIAPYRWLIINYKLRTGEPVPRTMIVPVADCSYEIREPYNTGGNAYYESRTITLNIINKTFSISKGQLAHTSENDNDSMIIIAEIIGIK